MTTLLLVVLGVLCGGLAGWRVHGGARERRRRRIAPGSRRILFPFVGAALSQPVLDATLRLARAEHATLVPAYLARVPLQLPLAAPLARECGDATALLEAIEHRATRAGVAVDTRIESGRTYRHALRELLAREPSERVVVAAGTAGSEGFDAADVAWLLEHAHGEILVLRPAHDRVIRPARGPQRTPKPSPLDNRPMSLDKPT